MPITPALNATGWNLLLEASPIQAVFTMFDASFFGYTVAILFFVYQFMLIMKTKNVALSFITGIFFISLYATSTYVKPASVQIMGLLLIFEFAGILYYLFLK